LGNEDRRSYWVRFALYILALSVGAASLGLFTLAEAEPDKVSLAGVGILLSFGMICLSVAGLKSIRKN
jgi:ABC-type multidrug transport system permease subunit